MVDANLKMRDDLREKNIEADTIHIEEVVFKNFKNLNKNMGSVIYFLTNDDNTGITARILNENKKHIINYGFLEKKYSKLDTQFLLYKNNIDIPENYFSSNLPSISKIQKDLVFPLILKSFKHLAKLSIFKSYPEYFSFVKDNQSNERFFEKYIAGNVVKAYAINGVVYFKEKDGKYFKNHTLINKIKKIGKILSLEAYSLDFIEHNKKFLFLDVNPAPAFFGCKEAYNNFIKYIRTNVERNRRR